MLVAGQVPQLGVQDPQGFRPIDLVLLGRKAVDRTGEQSLDSLNDVICKSSDSLRVKLLDFRAQRVNNTTTGRTQCER